MSTKTTNLGLTKPALTDNADITTINTNMDLIDTSLGNKADSSVVNAHLADNTKHIGYAQTSNSGNNYTVTIPNLTALSDGLTIRVKFNVASSGAITINLNGLGVKNVVDFFGNAVTNVRANLPAHLSYETVSGNFILLGKGGGINLQPTNFSGILSSYKIISFIPSENSIYVIEIAAANDPTKANGKVYKMNSSGTIIQAITCGYNNTAYCKAVGKNHIIWIGPNYTGSILYITDKNGTGVATSSTFVLGSYTYPIAVNSDDQRVYTSTSGSPWSVSAINTSCTFIGGTTTDNASIDCLAPYTGGAMIMNGNNSAYCITISGIKGSSGFTTAALLSNLLD